MNDLHRFGDASPSPAPEPGSAATASATMSQAESTAAAGDRLVRLFADGERSAALGFEPTASTWLALELPPAAARPERLLGTLAALLHRYTQQTVIALDVFMGDDAGTRPLALDIAVAGNVPIAQLIDGLPARLAAGTPAAPQAGPRASIAVQIIGASGELATGTDASALVDPAHPPYELRFVFACGPGASRLALVYNAALFRPATIARVIESYVVMLGAAWRDPAQTAGRLPLLGPAASRELTADQDSATAAYPTLPIHRLFEALAQRQPLAQAAVFQGRQMTYRELDERSSQLANGLVDRGVEPGDRVAVCIRPGLDILVALLAIWKARGVYLPLDPTHPEAHIVRMLEEARPRLALTSSELSATIKGVPQLQFDADAGALRPYSTVAPANEPQLADHAYLFYTSGTTGKPKGVLATQANLAQYIHSAAQKYRFRPDDVFSSLARYTFSISLFELVSPLCCGASLRLLDRDEVLSPDRLHQALDAVTVLHAGPSLLGSLFRHLRSAPAASRTLPRMRHASSGGDMVSPAVMMEMQQVFPNAELFVIYGCTEVSCMGTTFAIHRGTAVARTFVGKPFPNVTLRVLDPHAKPVPFGVVGEICFAGSGVVPGYLDRPELTAEKFVDSEGRRYYHTGDMGRLHADGNLEILGRRDFQVQLRGIRIELAGIEQSVQELGLAAQCAVVARTFGEGDVRLVAFVVKPGDARIAAFRRALAAQLPDYMLPHHLVVLDAMPLTANGKLDRVGLGQMPLDMPGQDEHRVGPDNETERQIAAVFAGVLRRTDVSVDESFFDLGGDSLLGVVLLEEIRRVTGVAIAPEFLFDGGSVRALAQQVRTSGMARNPRPILLNAKVPGPALFMLSGVHIYRKLAKRLEGTCSAYGVFTQREVGSFEGTGAKHSVQELAREYLEIIRAEQPAGPYRLLGYSFAGFVAYEVAQQIRASGEEVSLLVLVDTYLPEWLRGWTYRLAQIARLTSAPPRDVINFVVRRLRGRRMDGEFAGLHQGDKELGPLERRRDTVNLAAAAEYMSQLRPYDGRVHLIVSSARLQDDPLKNPSGGWSPYIRRLDIRSLGAHHLRMISEEPHVSEVAALLAARL